MNAPITAESVKALLAGAGSCNWRVDKELGAPLFFVCDENGLEAATARNQDYGTTALIAAAPDIATAYLEQAEEVERLRAGLAAVLNRTSCLTQDCHPDRLGGYCMEHGNSLPCLVGVARRLLAALSVDDPADIRARAGEQL